MARLGAPVSTAIWTLVTLTVIVCLGSQFSSAHFITDILRYSFGASNEPKTDDDWKKLGTAALEEIQKGGGKVSGDVKEWLEKLTGVSRDKDCSDKVAADLVSWRSVDKKFKKFHAVLDDYLKLYLDECGLEERFKAAIDKLKQGAPESWSSARYETLHNYLKGGDWSVNEAEELLSVVNDILELDSNTRKTDCTDEYMNSVVETLISDESGAAREFFDGYGRLYLDKCGFTARFERAIDRLKQVDSEHWSTDKYKTLHGYLDTRGPGFAGGIELFSVINDILELDGNIGKAKCTDENLIKLVKERIYTRRGDILYFHEGYVGFYLNECGFDERFEEAIGALKRVSPGRWSSYPHRTMYEYFKAKNWLHDDVIAEFSIRKFLSIVNDIFEINRTPEKTDCGTKHMIRVVREKGCDSEYVLQAYEDYAKLYLEKCGYEKRFKQAIDKLKQVSPQHWSRDCYKTLWGYLESREWNINGEMDLMSVVNTITKLDNIDEETDCTDERMIDVVMMEFYSLNRKFSNDYGELYSRKCGFENRFKEAVANVEKVSSKHWQSAKFPSLIRYLRFENAKSAKDGLLRLLPAIREISKPESITGDIDCSKERAARVSKWFVKYPLNHELYDFLSGYNKFYKEKCKL